MHFIHRIYNTILDALFPLSETEKKLFAMNEETAMNTLPKAPPVPIPAFAIFAYKNEMVSKLIWNIKYKKSQKAIRIASYALFMKIQTILNDTYTKENTVLPKKIYLLPIPITKRRRRERGFNQCELLIKEIENIQNSMGDKYRFRLYSNFNLLIREKHVSRQTLKDRQERLAGAKNIFGINSKELNAVKDSLPLDNILFFVIDDVITTGSTMLDAVKTLNSTGLRNVISLSVAH